MSDMEKRIETEIKGQKPAEVAELNLDNCKASSLSGLTEEFENLANLSMINCGLTSLEGFPKLPNLVRLDISDNKVSNFEPLAGCTSITHLVLCGNKVSNVSDLEPLKALTELESLDLYNCEVTKKDNDKYREEVFGMFSSLKYLDGTDVNGDEAESDVDSLGEDAGEDLGDDAEGEGDDEEDVGLSYLESSKVMDEDESEEYAPQDEDDAEEQPSRGTKRKRGEEGDEE
uniref:LRRcap domain-containing protein n=1 Tax=Steinernema glaseri TaxID=37863 RepID=A0A1I8AB79_9BILA